MSTKRYISLLVLALAPLVYQAKSLYWVGGSGSWSDISHWAESSGGTGGAALPTTHDDVLIDANSFGSMGSISLDMDVAVASMVANPSFTVNIEGSSDHHLVVQGEFDLSAKTVNNIQGEGYLIGKHAGLPFEQYKVGEFIGVNSYQLKKEKIGDQVLQVTAINETNVPQTCPESNDGQYSVVPQDGVGPFTYVWTIVGCPGVSGLGTNSLTDVCRGTHSLIIIDQSDPPGTQPFTSSFTMGPDPINPAILTTTSPACPGSADGSIVAFATGGTGAHVYTWTNGAPDGPNPTGLTAGSYDLTVTDQNLCVSQVVTANIDPSPRPNVTRDTTDILLCGGAGCTEDILFTAGAFAAATAWRNGGSATDMCPNDVFRDTLDWISPIDLVSACEIDRSHTATDPPQLAVTATEVQPVTCLGVDDGIITAEASNGTGPYQYTWLDVPGGPIVADTIRNLPTGTYTVEALDLTTLCTVQNTVDVTSPTPQVVNASITSTTDANCPTATNGEATVDATGGTPTYNWNWYDAPGTPTSQTITGLGPGTYNVEVIDQIGCVDTAQAVITSPPVSPVTASITNQVPSSCLGANNGEATADGAGGTPTYDFSWYDAPGTPTTQTITGLAPGTYNVQVTDQDGCRDTAQVDIVVPPISPVTASITSQTNSSCVASNNGEATADGAGGTPTYDFSWYDLPGMPTSQTVTGLAPGTYNVEVTDQDGCRDTAQTTITAPATSPVVGSISQQQDVICLGLPTGSATVSGTGGNPLGGIYDFEWYDHPTMPTTAQVTNLDVGIYNVEVMDQDGCGDTVTVTITAPNPPVITTTITITPASCTAGSCDATSDAVASGGQAPYTYDYFSIGGGPTANGDRTNLCPGIYPIAVMDINGCTDTSNAVIGGPVDAFIADQANIDCGGVCEGMIEIGATGGTGVYTYNFYDMTGTPTANAAGDSLFNVCGGSYNVEVSDGACLDTVPFTIVEPTPLVVNIDNQVNNLCSGQCNGVLEVSFSGGTGTLNPVFLDSAGVAPVDNQNFSLSALCSGTYTFEVTDQNNCTTNSPIDITSPQTTVNFNLSPICPGDVDANVQAIASGGASPYDYEWLDPVPGAQTNNIQVDMLPGSYDLEVTDANLCVDTFNLTFGIPTPFNITAIVTDAACQGVCNGNIDITATGGSAPYDFVWYDAPGTPTTEDLAAACGGTYNVALEDLNGCRDTLNNIVVNETTNINLAFAEEQATCQGICDGKIWVTAGGGLPVYTYDWYDAPPGLAVDDTLFNGCVGDFNVEVTDALGCLDTITTTVTAPIVVSSSFTNTVNNICSQDCNGSTEVVPAGGTGTIDILWLNVPGNPTTAAVSGLCVGTYDVELTDQNGCQDIGTIDITSQAGTITFSTTDPSCGGYSDGDITATVVGGPGPPAPTLTWLNITGNPTGNFVTGLPQGTYDLEVLDANGCRDTFPANLVDPFPAINLQTDSQTVTCFGICDGKGWATPLGGSAPFEYSWYNDPSGSIIDTAFNLCVGTYFVAVEDNDGCRDSAEVIITNPFSIDLTIDSKVPCFGVCDGFSNAIVAGGPRPLLYQWDDPTASTDSMVTNLCAGDYKVIVSNASGCVDSSSITLNENPQITATLDTTKATCTNTTNGGASIVPAGGTPPYTYLWSDGGVYSSTSPAPSDLGIGTYTVAVTDFVGCPYNDAVTISEVYTLTPDAGFDAAICEGDSITLTASGGNDYVWNTGETTASIKVAPFVTTNYEVQVSNGICTDNDDLTITVRLNPTASASTDATALLEGTGMIAQLTGEGAGPNGTYDWTPPNSLSDPTEQNPQATPAISTTYFLTVEDENGCQDTASVHVLVIESILYPDAITPNGDGINDDWPIVYIENFPSATVEIYNRWGQLLFQSVGYSEPWDGTYKDKELPVGTYYFIIDLGPDLPKKTGPITIFR